MSNNSPMKTLPYFDRRAWLKAAGVSISLPWLDRFAARAHANESQDSRHRMVYVCTTLGLYTPNLFPQSTGADYELTPYLQLVEGHRNDLTLFSGMSHPEQSGADGHSSEKTLLTSAPHPGLGGFRNTISVDQLAAEKLGYATRFPSLTLGTSRTSQSYTRSGVMIPAMSSPAKVFAELFLEGSDDEVQKQVRRLREGRSILDAVAQEARRIQQTSGREDRERLEEYFESVREMERRLEAAQAWIAKKKPEVHRESPKDIANESDIVGRAELMFELIPLALQTDSTRVITMTIQGRNDVPPVPGVSVDHHNLSHHGQEETKIEQLTLIETAIMSAFGKLMGALGQKNESGQRLLDQTSVVFGSNLGNANSHDWRNLPIILAGGGFSHGSYRAFDEKNNLPLSNLFLTLLQHQGHEVESFGSSTATMEL